MTHVSGSLKFLEISCQYNKFYVAPLIFQKKILSCWCQCPIDNCSFLSAFMYEQVFMTAVGTRCSRQGSKFNTLNIHRTSKINRFYGEFSLVGVFHKANWCNFLFLCCDKHIQPCKSSKLWHHHNYENLSSSWVFELIHNWVNFNNQDDKVIYFLISIIGATFLIIQDSSNHKSAYFRTVIE